MEEMKDSRCSNN